ncbi:hypothetical protein HPB47_007641, partial [Ixodes persulcatus]
FLLDKLVDLEPLLGFLVQVPRVETQHSMELRIQSCLSLRQVLESVEPLRLLLSKAGPDSLLARCASDLQNDRYARLGEVAGVVTHSNVKYRRDSWQKVLQLCDAIKTCYQKLKLASTPVMKSAVNVGVWLNGLDVLLNKIR